MQEKEVKGEQGKEEEEHEETVKEVEQVEEEEEQEEIVGDEVVSAVMICINTGCLCYPGHLRVCVIHMLRALYGSTFTQPKDHADAST